MNLVKNLEIQKQIYFQKKKKNNNIKYSSAESYLILFVAGRGPSRRPIRRRV